MPSNQTKSNQVTYLIYMYKKDLVLITNNVWYPIKLMLVKCERYLLNNGVSIYPNPQISVADVLDYNIVVNEFDNQSDYYVHFRINSRRKCMNFFIPLGMGSLLPRLSFY